MRDKVMAREQAARKAWIKDRREAGAQKLREALVRKGYVTATGRLAPIRVRWVLQEEHDVAVEPWTFARILAGRAEPDLRTWRALSWLTGLTLDEYLDIPDPGEAVKNLARTGRVKG